MLNCTVSSASWALLATCSACLHSVPCGFLNKMGKAGTQKVPCYKYKDFQRRVILLIWNLKLAANIYGHDQ